VKWNRDEEENANIRQCRMEPLVYYSSISFWLSQQYHQAQIEKKEDEKCKNGAVQLFVWEQFFSLMPF
jgi:hypothetical protein